MGFDIVFYVERRCNGTWESADKWTPSEEWEIEEGAPPLGVAIEDRYYNTRDYEMFSILANVRQSVGLVSKKDGGRLQYISLPKGFPLDASPNVAAWIRALKAEHVISPSWLSLAELLNFDWERRVTLHFQMQGEDYLKMLNNEVCFQGRGHWRGAMSEKRAKRKLSSKFNSTPEEAASLLRTKKATMPKWLLKRSINTTENVTYGDVAFWFRKNVMERMAELGDPEDVRCVFYFC